MKRLFKNFSIVLTLFAGLAGCATAPDSAASGQAYEQYRAQFTAAQPYTVHSVVRKDGARVSAREFSPSLRGKGATLVMMHGFPDNQHLYDLLIPTLANQHHIVSFDFLGWGESDKPLQHGYDVASQRADLNAVVEQLKLDSVVPVVHDLSGQVGIDWALDNEARTAGLVLLNTYYLPMPTLIAPEAIEFYSKPGWLRDLAVWGANKSASRFQSGLSNQLERFMSNPAAREVFIPVLAHRAPEIRPAFFSSTAVLWQELAEREKMRPRMLQFKKPVAVIFGVDDPYLNTGVAKEFKRLFSNASLHLIDKAGHYVQLDQAQAVGRLIEGELARR